MNEPPNRILEFLTAPAQPAGEASRANRRRRTTARIELAWSEGATWRAVRGRLRDISRGGASLLAAGAPPLTRLARIRFAEGEGSPWVQGEVLEVTSETPRRHRVRFRFEDPCPSFMLRLAVLGDVESEAEEVSAPRYEWATSYPETFE